VDPGRTLCPAGQFVGVTRWLRVTAPDARVGHPDPVHWWSVGTIIDRPGDLSEEDIRTAARLTGQMPRGRPQVCVVQ
jgi:hypothetical protein